MACHRARRKRPNSRSDHSRITGLLPQEATTNLPLARIVNKANNLEEAITGNHLLWQRAGLILGWSRWNVGVKDEEYEEAKDTDDTEKLEKIKSQHFIHKMHFEAQKLALDVIEDHISALQEGSEGKVTNSQQDNLAFYSGDPVQDYGMVLFTDDERKWVGLDVGENGEGDVRGSIMSDQAESIIDIYDRLKPMEGLYDMLLGSISSCF